MSKPSKREIVDALDQTMIILASTLTSKGYAQWLDAKNRYLKGISPREAIQRGQFQLAVEAAHAFAEGAYV